MTDLQILEDNLARLKNLEKHLVREVARWTAELKGTREVIADYGRRLIAERKQAEGEKGAIEP